MGPPTQLTGDQSPSTLRQRDAGGTTFVAADPEQRYRLVSTRASRETQHVTTETTSITIPSELLPADGRFGCGPSKVRPSAVDALAAAGRTYLGTSHRQATVRSMVGRLREGLTELFGLPDGYEVALGNGGTTVLWDALTFGLIERRSQHLTFGEFSSKFATCARQAPHLDDPEVIEAPVGSAPTPIAREGIDVYALTHNETSTGVAATPTRPDGATADALVAVDATSAAGGLRFDPHQVDAYYFAPQKCLASDGGLWLAALSPVAIERIERIAASDRWIPASLDLATALDNSRKNQTYNTPSLATVLLAVEQVEWILANGGLEWAAGRCDTSAATIYEWADAGELTTPFVSDPALRSHVVATIDVDERVDATVVAATLRANGIVDTEPYRKLGRNQLRVALFPAIDPADVVALTRCIDHVIDHVIDATD
ncbi:MAG: phosphoserine transaminase [Acidimicrobiia bacterium]|nr:phosphoserine transaminase [Acidimicrobiia bacterium]